MANRSYLYAIDFDMAVERKEDGGRILGLSEYPYSIPLSYLILVSQSSKLTHSIIWDYEHPIAIQGIFEKGQQKLTEYLSKLSYENIFEKNELEKQIAEMTAFLNDHKLEYILLECGEIYEMDDGVAEDQNKTLFENDILKIDERLEYYTNIFKKINSNILAIKSEIAALSKPKWFFSKLPSADLEKIKVLEEKMKNEEQSMWDILGINYWDDVLYYDFNSE